MAILEKEVLVGLSGKNAKHYEELGYSIPRGKDKKGRITITRGTKILVRIEDLPRGSDVRLTKICDEKDCGKHIPNQVYKVILDLRDSGDGKDRCVKCGNIRRGVYQKDNTTYERSLEYRAKMDNKEYLLTEFSSKNSKRPDKIAYKSNDLFIWNCGKCKGDYQERLSNRANGRNCPYCAGRKVLIGFNDLWTTHPHVAELLNDPQRGYMITAGSNKNEMFKCNNCGFGQSKIVVNVSNQGFSCSKCSDGISYPEKFVTCLLDQLKIKYERQKSFEWIINRNYDFYIYPNVIIETHGKQHYEDTGFNKLNGKSLEDERKNDELKMSMAKLNKINNYIVLNCSKSNSDYIKNSIINSKLSEMYNLEDVDWNKCNEYAYNTTLIKTACEIWNSGIKSTVEIGEILKLERNTIINYLKKGANELGWCNYDPKEELRKRGKQQGGKNAMKIVQLSINNEYIKGWNSITEAGITLNMDFRFIQNACAGRNKTAGGYIWMYLDAYKENKNNLIPYKRKTKGKNIVKLDLNDHFLEEYPSMTKAAEALNGNKINGISLACNGSRKTAGGYKWMYKEDYDKQFLIKNT